MSFHVSLRAFVLVVCGLCLLSVFFNSLYGSHPTVSSIPPSTYATAFISFQTGVLGVMAAVFPSGDLAEFCQPYLLFFKSTMSAASSHVAAKWAVNDEAPVIERLVRTSVASLIAATLLVQLLQFWQRPNTPFWRSVRGYLLGLGVLRLMGTAVLVYSLGSEACPPGDLTPTWAVVCNVCSLLPVALLNEKRRIVLAQAVRHTCRQAGVRLPFFPSLQHAQRAHDQTGTPPERALPKSGETIAAPGSNVQQLFWDGYICFFGAFVLSHMFLVEDDAI